MAVHNPKTDGSEFVNLLEDLEDGEHVRIIESKGHQYKAIADGQYSLWRIQPLKGKLPGALSGLFTSPLEAEKAIKAYVAKATAHPVNDRHREKLGLTA